MKRFYRTIRRQTAIAGLVLFVGAGAAAAIEFDELGGPVTTKSYASLNTVPQGGTIHVAVELKIKHPWHVNAHEVGDEFLVPTEIEFAPRDGVTIREIVYPKGIEKKLDFSEEPMALYEGTVYIGALVEVAADVPEGHLPLKATVTYQACDNQKCLIPETEDVFIQLTVSSPQAAVDMTHPEIFEKIEFAGASDGEGEDTAAGSLQDAIASKGMFFGFLLVFIGGLALNLTPCVYPIIPITVSYFGGQAGGKTSKTVLLAVLYLLGMATMYSALGLAAALTGSILGAALQNPFVLGFVALVMIGLAMSMFGFYEIRIPTALSGFAGTAKQGVLGSFLMGLTVGIVAAPCIGPFVLGLLTFVGESGDPLLGFSMFFTLAVGLGLPFVALAIASGNISRLPKSGEWMEWIRKLFGVVLLGMAIFFLRPLLTDPVYFAAMGLLLVAGGVILGFVLKVGSSAVFFNAFRRFVGLAAPAVGLYLVLAPGNIRARGDAEGIAWQPYNVETLAEAKDAGKPVVIDFSAEWCLPCKELDHKTFNQPESIEAVEAVVPLKADLTKAGSEHVRKLREQYNILGVPTLVFIDASGKERAELRAVGFIDKDAFVERVVKLGG